MIPSRRLTPQLLIHSTHPVLSLILPLPPRLATKPWWNIEPRAPLRNRPIEPLSSFLITTVSLFFSSLYCTIMVLVSWALSARGAMWVCMSLLRNADVCIISCRQKFKKIQWSPLVCPTGEHIFPVSHSIKKISSKKSIPIPFSRALLSAYFVYRLHSQTEGIKRTYLK